jgi:hypothetical protein
MTDVVFIYVRADEELVKQLADELARRGVTSSERPLRLGDNLSHSVQDGLTKARYVILVLSRGFFSRPWPRGELDQLARIDREYQGETKLLPIWHGITQQDLSFYSPSLAEKVGVLSSSGLAAVVADITEVVQPGNLSVSMETQPARPGGERVGSTSTDLVRLISVLNDSFSTEELYDLCFRLNVDFENLAGGTKSAKTRELVLYLQRRGQLNSLVSLARSLRPNANW